jgi:uncharacterized membrane protein YphA (DoxX/SURF4 family)
MSLWRRIVAYLGVAFAGFMFLVAGLLKGLDPGSFAAQITGDVPFLDAVSAPLAIAGVAVETILGVAFLLGFRRRWLLAVGLLLVVLFIAVTVPKLGSDDPTGCGCFGNFVVRTPAEVIMEDLAMGAGLLLGFIGGPGSTFRSWRRPAVALAAVLGLGLPLAAPALPLDNFATRLKPGATVADLQLQEAMPEMESGTHVVIIADETLDACQDIPESLFTYTDERPEQTFWLVRPSEVLAREGATWLCMFGTEMVEIPNPVARPLYRTLPRSFEVVNGVVTRTWEGLPGS